MARKAAAVANKLPAPKAGMKPDFAGVPGEIISLDGLQLVWGGRRKVSPYDALLDDLAKRTDEAVEKQQPRPGLKFGAVRCKASVYARAKAKGLRVSFAEFDGALYVRMDGRVDDDVRATRRSRIGKMLAQGAPLHNMQITAKLREAGDATVDAPLVDAILAQMMRAGEVVRQEGGAWKANPAKRVA